MSPILYHPRDKLRFPEPMLLTIIIPVYNEEGTIIESLERVRALPIAKEVIVVDDGSTDGTGALLSGVDWPEFKVLRRGENCGKGAAVRMALAEARGEAVAIHDGDLEYDPQDLIKMLQAMEELGAQAVYGSRIISRAPASSWGYWLGGRLLSWVTNLLFGSRITDEPTCYKMVRRSVLNGLELKATGFELCPEMTAKLLKSGHHIPEVPISYTPRSFQEGKKIRWHDGLVAIWTLLWIRLTWAPPSSLPSCSSKTGE